jgi:hypothetical protein
VKLFCLIKFNLWILRSHLVMCHFVIHENSITDWRRNGLLAYRIVMSVDGRPMLTWSFQYVGTVWWDSDCSKFESNMIVIDSFSAQCYFQAWKNWEFGSEMDFLPNNLALLYNWRFLIHLSPSNSASKANRHFSSSYRHYLIPCMCIFSIQGFFCEAKKQKDGVNSH